MKKIFLLFPVLYLFFACASKQKADLLIYNATIYTVDASFSKVEAMVIKRWKDRSNRHAETIGRSI
jgi:hypothetical protein